MLKEQEIFEEIEEEMMDLYGPKQCNLGHDNTHVQRVLAMLEICKGKLDISVNEYYILKLAILFHNLDRTKTYGGRKEDKAAIRRQFIREKLQGLDEKSVNLIIYIVDNHGKKEPDPPPTEVHSKLISLLRDLDKSDVGAFGVLRCCAVAAAEAVDGQRPAGFFRASDFDPDVPATEGDDNVASVADDLKFCGDWFDGPENFRIKNPIIREKSKGKFAFMRHFFYVLGEEARQLQLF